MQKITVDGTDRAYYTNSDKCFGGILFAWFAASLYYFMTFISNDDKISDYELWSAYDATLKKS